MEKLISDCSILPEQVRKGDFVLNLSEGVTEPEKTLDQYVVTPATRWSASTTPWASSGRPSTPTNSKACYLHGSFGSGKSHFMAVLHLLLQHNPAVRASDDLAKVCAKHGWVEDKKFLLVPYHMIGARNMESAILGGYVDHVMQLHPDAPLPGVYLADDIFENALHAPPAARRREVLRDLNQGNQAAGGSGWGKLAAGWDAARFEAALAAPPASEDRTRLVGDLVQHIFPAFQGIAQGKDEAYVDLDVGLSVISAHAKALGYDALILFLDELILWLATHSADLGFVQTEGQQAGQAGRVPHARPPGADHQLRRPPARPPRPDRRERHRGRAAQLRRRAQALGGPVPHHHPGGPQPPGHRREAGPAARRTMPAGRNWTTPSRRPPRCGRRSWNSC